MPWPFRKPHEHEPFRRVDCLREELEYSYGCASLLDKSQRKRVQRALELSGFETYPISTVVDDVLKLVALAAPTVSDNAGPG